MSKSLSWLCNNGSEYDKELTFRGGYCRNMTRRMEIRRGRISFTTINKFFLLMVLIIVNMIVTQLLIVLDKDLIHEETRLRNGNILATSELLSNFISLKP